ncbi:hypothetical protein CDD81_3206 [Ophiocordyceps australis]|uniref:Helix-turn-helix domain-containing protein n=1 Tax=Ophiocordyceps australis TaxID=1399860 RepID=A0A2C5XWD6_9HYPO|nr:hypothetical protein CDD81_3206 [Ophiocordyceps australis]
MGSSWSKGASAAGRQGAVRKFPTRVPTTPAPPKPLPVTSDSSKTQAIRTDAIDADIAPGGFSKRLHQMGIAQPQPTLSHSSVVTAQATPASSSNATLSVLEARRLLQQKYNEDQKAGRSDRRLVDMRTLVVALKMRQRGIPGPEIETKLGLETGLVNKLGQPNIVTHLTATK